MLTLPVSNTREKLLKQKIGFKVITELRQVKLVAASFFSGRLVSYRVQNHRAMLGTFVVHESKSETAKSERLSKGALYSATHNFYKI